MCWYAESHKCSEFSGARRVSFNKSNKEETCDLEIGLHYRLVERHMCDVSLGNTSTFFLVKKSRVLVALHTS